MRFTKADIDLIKFLCEERLINYQKNTNTYKQYEKIIKRLERIQDLDLYYYPPEWIDEIEN